MVRRPLVWKRHGKFLNATEGIRPEINRLVIIDDGGSYRGRVFSYSSGSTAWQEAFVGVAWQKIGRTQDGLRYDCSLTPEQYAAIKQTGQC